MTTGCSHCGADGQCFELECGCACHEVAELRRLLQAEVEVRTQVVREAEARAREDALNEAAVACAKEATRLRQWYAENTEKMPEKAIEALSQSYEAMTCGNCILALRAGATPAAATTAESVERKEDCQTCSRLRQLYKERPSLFTGATCAACGATVV